MQPLITSVRDIISVRGGMLRILGNSLQSADEVTVHIGSTSSTIPFNSIDTMIEVQIPALEEYGTLDIYVEIEGHTTDTIQGHIISDLKDVTFPCPVNFDALDYRQNIKRLLPKGQALRYRAGSNIDKIFYAAADEQARFNGLVCKLFKELTALTTEELLEEWEADYGLPEGCGDPNAELTVDMRRDILLTKLNAQGGQTPQYYIYLASLLGYEVQVIEYSINYEYPILQEGNPMCGSVLFCMEPYFKWGVLVDGDIRDDLVCMLEKYKPYHTKINIIPIYYLVDENLDYIIDENSDYVITL